MVFTPDPGKTVEKLMSCTLAEFHTGLERLTGAAPRLVHGGLYDLSVAANGQPVTCTFEPQPDAVLGGLMRLPRVKVTLQLTGLDEETRDDLVARFDQVFQRGGG